MNNAFQFFKMQLFWAALPGDIRHVIAQKGLAESTLDEINKAATNINREMGKTTKSIVAVHEESDSSCNHGGR